MADRVPLPRVSAAYAAATAGTNGVVVGIESTAPVSAVTAANPLEVPVARAALLTMASELTVLDTLGFLSGPVGGGRDFAKAYRAALESLASPDPPPSAGTALVSSLRSCAADALVALFSSHRADADAVSALLDAANARISQAVLLGQSSAASGAATAFAAVETTDAGFWKGSNRQPMPSDLLTLAAARGPSNLKARPGADRAAARQEATLGVAGVGDDDDDVAAAVAAAAVASGEAGAARGGKGGAKKGGGAAAAARKGKGGAAAAGGGAGAAVRKALNLPSPSDLPPILAYELAFMLERAVAPASPEELDEPEEEEPEMAPAGAGSAAAAAAPDAAAPDAAPAASTEPDKQNPEDGGDHQPPPSTSAAPAPPGPASLAEHLQQVPAPRGAHRIREACRKRVAALRATRAGEVARVLDVDASGIAAALRAGRYDDVEVLCADVAAVVRRAAEASAEALATSAVEAAAAAAAAASAAAASAATASAATAAPEDDGPGRGRGRGAAGATTMRKGKLLGLADQYCMSLTSAIAEIALDFGSAERKKSRKGGGSRRTTRAAGDPDPASAAAQDPNAPPQLDEHGNPVVVSPSRLRTAPMPEAIQANREPYLHGAWRRRPYAPRPYERLKAYKVNSMSKPLVEWKLTTEKRGQCDGSACAVAPGSLGTYSLEMEAFDTGCACLKNNLECGPNCGCAEAARRKGLFSDDDPTSTEFPAACANRAVTRRETLVLNKDVKEVNAWGMDCYSRRNIVDAVLESQAFGSYVKPDYRALARAAEVQAAALARGEKIHRDEAGDGGGGGCGKGGKEQQGPTSPDSRPGSAALTAHCCSAATRERVSDWVERVLHPAINGQGAQGWDLARALRQLVECGSEAAAKKKAEASASGAAAAAGKKEPAPSSSAAAEAEAALTAASVNATSAASASAAAAVLARFDDVGSDYFRVHPKGVGMQVIRPGGLPRLTFVEEYLGEVHSPWRWFEVQDALKKVTKDELPDFYNIVLERPRDDPWGYDALFVDAASRGAFASRMSHSCTPNCQAVVMACGGRLTIAVYTLRHVFEGEELTFDYASVTESEKEFRDAICLCGTSGCRGSFLTFSGSRAFQAVMNEKHNVLHRQAIILHAGDSSELTEKDRTVLDRFGVRDSALGRRNLAPEEEAAEGGVMARRVPAWLEKWAALILHYVERECDLLPEALLALPPALGGGYSRPSAMLEARGVADSRLQNVVITVDKIKYVLSQSGPEAQSCAPLRRLTDAEAADHIWNGDRSIARRLLRAAAPTLSTPQVARGLATAATAAEVRRALERSSVGPGLGHHPQLHELSEAVLREPPAASFEEARQRLLGLVPMLRIFDAEARGGHTAAADIATMYARTRVWFSAERRFASFTSPAVRLAPSDLCVIGDGGGGAAGAAGTVGAPAKKKQKVAAKKKGASKSASLAAAAMAAEARAAVETAAAAGEPAAEAAAPPPIADAAATAAEGSAAAPVDAAAAAASGPAPTTTAATTTVAAATADAAAAAPAASDAAPADAIAADAAAAAAPDAAGAAAPAAAAAEAPPPPPPPPRPESDLLPLHEGALCDPVPPHLPPAADDEAGLVDEATAARAGLAKKYGPWFIWGQLSGWFKQTVYDPTASLSAERRGTISLPDIESCYGGCARSRYQQRDRAAMLDHVSMRPDAMWRLGTLWSFKNEGKIYGSPAFDSRWSELTGEFEDPMPALLRELRGTWIPYGGKGGGVAASKAAAAASAPAATPAAAATAMEVDNGNGGGSAAGVAAAEAPGT